MDGLTRALVEGAVAVREPRGPVVEIGSRQVQEGLAIADLRPLFPGLDYTGCDMIEGPGVDRIERLEALSFADESVGTVLCLNVIEHAWDFRKGMDEIRRVTAPGGFALVSSVFQLDVHAFPYDFWRFTPQAMARLMEGFETVLYGWQGHPKASRLVFALGLKAPVDDPAALAEAWRRETLARWTEQPSWRVRLGAAVGSRLFGRRYFRTIRHWWDLTMKPAARDGDA